jgi:carboxyl-terminal processing protease
MNRIPVLIAVGAGFLFPVTLPAQAEPGPASAQAQLTLDDLRTFTDVFNQARRNYVDEVDDRTLLESAMRGMLTALDPHSEYLPPGRYEDLGDASRGRYSGVGVSLTTWDGRILVDAVINGSPADEAGINPGDTITAIDQVPVKGRYLPEAIDDMDGEPDTEVELSILTPAGEEREVRLVREYISIPSLAFELLDDSWGYFRMTSFHSESANHLREALESVKANEAPLRGLILDLRNNPGGVLQPAVDIADGFLESGRIVTTRGRTEEMALSFEASPGDWLPGLPVVVLVDRGTASASEVLAGALQVYGRALIVGERTFGKGSVQSVLPLRNGGGIKLTTARYYTPSGRSIQARGIVPDLEVAWAEDQGGQDRLREADLDRHINDETDAAEDEFPQERLLIDFDVDEILAVLEKADLIGGESPSGESGG